MNEVFEVHTSCGGVFRHTLDELGDWQIASLIEQNPDNPGTDVLREEQARREAARSDRCEASRSERRSMSSTAEKNFTDFILASAPPGANVVVGGKLVQGEMTPALAAALDLRARLTAMGDDLTEDDAERISAEWRAAWPGMNLAPSPAP